MLVLITARVIQHSWPARVQLAQAHVLCIPGNQRVGS